MKILISGSQGSGKTTQANLLSRRLNLPVIDIGQKLRDLAKTDSEEAIKINESILKGELAPDQIVADLMRAEVEKAAGDFIADGYPRSLNQAKLYDPNYDLVFYLSIPDSVAVDRLLRRDREDDLPEVIKLRLKNYHLLTEEVTSKFKERGVLYKIDGCLSINAVHQKIMEVIDAINY